MDAGLRSVSGSSGQSTASCQMIHLPTRSSVLKKTTQICNKENTHHHHLHINTLELPSTNLFICSSSSFSVCLSLSFALYLLVSLLYSSVYLCFSLSLLCLQLSAVRVIADQSISPLMKNTTSMKNSATICKLNSYRQERGRER